MHRSSIGNEDDLTVLEGEIERGRRGSGLAFDKVRSGLIAQNRREAVSAVLLSFRLAESVPMDETIARNSCRGARIQRRRQNDARKAHDPGCWAPDFSVARCDGIYHSAKLRNYGPWGQSAKGRMRRHVDPRKIMNDRRPLCRSAGIEVLHRHQGGPAPERETHRQ